MGESVRGVPVDADAHRGHAVKRLRFKQPLFGWIRASLAPAPTTQVRAARRVILGKPIDKVTPRWLECDGVRANRVAPTTRRARVLCEK